LIDQGASPARLMSLARLITKRRSIG
jgi:hypothetical protein